MRRLLLLPGAGGAGTEVLAALAQPSETPKALALVERLVDVRMMEQGAVRAILDKMREGGPLPKLE